AILAHAGEGFRNLEVEEVEEIAGHGLKGRIDGKELLVGNSKLLQKFNVSFPAELEEIVETIVIVTIDKQYAGYITIADAIKEDAVEAITKLREYGIKTIVMLSGDKDSIVQKVAEELKIDQAFGGLLPQDKVSKVEELKSQGKKVAFVGDGINDAPVITLADVGIAMGALGSDAAIETA